jgi:septum formation protein
VRAHRLALVLASASPRRRELISRLGIETLLAVPIVDESRREGEPPTSHVLRIAREKARSVAEGHPGLPVIGADTSVVLGDTIYGKPRGRSEARRMLSELRGRTHTVLTALCVRFKEREADHLEAARVTMSAYPDELLEWYVALGEGDDKAGGYAIQGRAALLVERLEGNVQAVVGLPLAPLPALFGRVGLLLAAKGPKLSLTVSQ